MKIFSIEERFQEDRQGTETGEIHDASKNRKNFQFLEGFGIQIDFHQTFTESIETPQSETDGSDESEGRERHFFISFQLVVVVYIII